MNEPSKGEHRLSRDEPVSPDEGGLRAPPGPTGWRKAWWWFDFIILAKLARLRFIGILAAIGVVITQWDALLAYYDRWTRPQGVETATASDVEYFCPMHLTVVRDGSKEKCPVCFMPLARRKKGLESEAALPPSVVNRVQLSPYRVVLAGVGTVEIDYLPLTRQIRLFKPKSPRPRSVGLTPYEPMPDHVQVPSVLRKSHLQNAIRLHEAEVKYHQGRCALYRKMLADMNAETAG